MSWKSTAIGTAALSLATLVCGALAIALGGPSPPAALDSINHPFKAADYSSLPPVSRLTSRNGDQLAYRAYPAKAPSTKNAVVLIHGSSASSVSMHALADALAQAGHTAYALDIRGHGASGVKGDIDYIGQLEDDLEDFVKALGLSSEAVLLGFSSGGGFALRVAGSTRQELFAGYLLLAPFIHQDATTFKPNSGGWVSVGLPRIIALAILNQTGITALNDLPVVSFALNEQAKALLTPHYSFSLAQNFRPQHDYGLNIRSARQPMELVAGGSDEVFHSERFQAVFNAHGKTIPIAIVPDASHIDLIIKPAAIQAALASINRLRASAAGTVADAGAGAQRPITSNATHTK